MVNLLLLVYSDVPQLDIPKVISPYCGPSTSTLGTHTLHHLRVSSQTRMRRLRTSPLIRPSTSSVDYLEHITPTTPIPLLSPFSAVTEPCGRYWQVIPKKSRSKAAETPRFCQLRTLPDVAAYIRGYLGDSIAVQYQRATRECPCHPASQAKPSSLAIAKCCCRHLQKNSETQCRVHFYYDAGPGFSL